MYRRETKEKAAYAGNRTRRTDSVKQHEMAALREMEQMVLEAENSDGKGCSTSGKLFAAGQKDPHSG